MSYPNMSQYKPIADGIDYKNIYFTDDMKLSAIHWWWERKTLKWSDCFPALAYAGGIPIFENFNEVLPEVKEAFPHVRSECFRNNASEGGADKEYLEDQINFFIKNKNRTPKKVLEIGGGNGSISLALAHMGAQVQCVDPMQNALTYFRETNEHYFNRTEDNFTLINKPLHESLEDIDWEELDTVIMCESIEHILEKDFNPFYKKMLTHLKGYFIVTNHVDWMPIHIGSGAIPEEHCRTIDDALYDRMSEDFDEVVLRIGSHLVLNKK